MLTAFLGSLSVILLAMALMLQHGTDLFADKTIREATAKALGLACPNRWHPGLRLSFAYLFQAFLLTLFSSSAVSSALLNERSFSANPSSRSLIF